MSGTARALAVAVALVAAWGAWRWLTTSPEERVLQAVDAVATTLSARAADPLGQVAALGQLRRHLAPDIVIRSGSGADVTGRDAAVGLWQRVRASADAVRVRVLDPAVVVAGDGQTATVDGVVEATFERGGVPERDVREVRLTWRLVDGEWLASGATLVDAVTPPQE